MNLCALCCAVRCMLFAVCYVLVAVSSLLCCVLQLALLSASCAVSACANTTQVLQILPALHPTARGTCHYPPLPTAAGSWAVVWEGKGLPVCFLLTWREWDDLLQGDGELVGEG